MKTVPLLAEGEFSLLEGRLPESFYEFTEKLGVLYEALGTLNSTELQAEVLKLLDEIYAKLLVTDKGKGESERDD